MNAPEFRVTLLVTFGFTFSGFTCPPFIPAPCHNEQLVIFETQSLYDALEGALSHLGIAHNLLHFDIELVIVW